MVHSLTHGHENNGSVAFAYDAHLRLPDLDPPPCSAMSLQPVFYDNLKHGTSHKSFEGISSSASYDYEGSWVEAVGLMNSQAGVT